MKDRCRYDQHVPGMDGNKIHSGNHPAGGQKNILGDYAGTNYHEFWAVSVEVFFENPIRFRHELPHLFNAISRLLRQDPIVVTSQNKMAA